MSDIALKVEQTRAEGAIGASEAAGILGLDKYRSPLWHWQRMRGHAIDTELPAAVQEAAEFGQLLEPIIRGRYALQRGVAVFVPVSSIVREDWLRATPDGVVGPGDPGTQEWVGLPSFATGLLQVKCRSAWQRENWLNGVPPAEEVQCRVEMAVCDLPWNDCAVLLGGNQMLVHRIERDAKLEDNILRDLKAFWEMVQSGKEPEVDGSDAWRQYASSRMSASKVTINADAELEAQIRNWVQARRSRKAIEEAEEEIKTKILLRLSAAGATKIHSPLGDVTAYRSGGRTDWKAYAMSLGGLNTPPERFKTESKTWSLRAPADDDE